MITTNSDGSFEFTSFDKFIDRFTHLGTLAIAEPADPRGQSLKLNPVARQGQPAIKGSILWE
jgi:hypothetical protein